MRKLALLLLASSGILGISIATFVGVMSPAQKVTKEFKPREKGWWQLEDGVFARWCDEKFSCPETSGYGNHNWRLLVWCKESDCGTITASANIIQDKIIVANTVDTAIAYRGDKVILTFSHQTNGSARLIRFKTEDGARNTFPILNNSD